MNASPVALRELLVAARRPSTLWIRLGAGVAGAVILALSFGANVLGGSFGGEVVFGSLVALTALIVAFSGLLVTADAISSESRDGTLGLLFLTDLRGFDVVAGKLVGAGVSAAGALAAVLPMLAVTVLFGGVTGGDVGRSAVALLNLLWVSLTLGLYVSTRTSDLSRALFAAFLAGVLLFVLAPFGARITGSGLLGSALPWLLGVSPAWTLIAARDANFTLSPAAYWQSLILSHGLGWAFAIAAAKRITQGWREGKSARRSSAFARLPRAASRASTENPVAALTRPSRREGAVVWSIVVVSVVMADEVLPRAFPRIGIWGFWPLEPAFWILLSVFAWKCCAFFHQLKSGAGELLLTTPVNELQLLGGAWAGARRLVATPLVLLFAFGFLRLSIRSSMNDGQDILGFSVLSGGLVIFGLYKCACLGVDLVALAWLSALFGVRTRSALSAWGLCLAVLFLPRLLLLCVPDLLISAVMLAGARKTVVDNVRGWLTGDRPPRPSALTPAG